jgi:hypothetical protein
MILLISASQVAGITGLSHHAQLEITFKYAKKKRLILPVSQLFLHKFTLRNVTFLIGR